MALQDVGNSVDLNLGGVLEAAFPDGPLEVILQEQLVPTSEVEGIVVFVVRLDHFFFVGAVEIWDHAVLSHIFKYYKRLNIPSIWANQIMPCVIFINSNN